MVSLAFCSPKGGTGKTTLAFNIGERAVADGLRVALVDCDEQEGSVALSCIRRDVHPGLSQAWSFHRVSVSGRGAAVISSLRDGSDYDLVICDLPGAESPFLGTVLSGMDLVLSPVGPGTLDLLSAGNFWDRVEPFHVPVFFVGNKVSRWPSRQAEIVRQLAEWDARVCPAMVQLRVAHLEAIRRGKGVCEYLPDSAAAEEVNGLWAWVKGSLGLEGVC